MKAVLSLKIDLLEPAHVVTVADVLELQPSQVREISILFAAGGRPLIEAVVANVRDVLHDLVSLVQNEQPAGTSIEIWYHGRSETIRI